MVASWRFDQQWPLSDTSLCPLGPEYERALALYTLSRNVTRIIKKLSGALIL